MNSISLNEWIDCNLFIPCLIRDNGHPCLVPHFKENISKVSALSLTFARGFCYVLFNVLKKFPNVFSSLRAFIILQIHFFAQRRWLYEYSPLIC